MLKNYKRHARAVWHSVKDDGFKEQCNFHLIFHVLTFRHESTELLGMSFDHDKVMQPT